jgi:transcriptional regulator with XRE-family HTH domain
VTPAELLAWRTQAEFSQAGLAAILGVDRQTVYRWEHGERSIPPYLGWALLAIEPGTAASAQRKRAPMIQTPFDAAGARLIINDWLLEHGDDEIDDEGATLSDYLECFPEIRDSLERRIALALGSAVAPRNESVEQPCGPEPSQR